MVVENCPKCGHRIYDLIYPSDIEIFSITERCFNCGWSQTWTKEWKKKDDDKKEDMK